MNEFNFPQENQHAEKHVEFEISKFIDHELDSEDEKKLFAHLAECTKCRSAFTDYLKFKTETKNFYTDLGKGFDEPLQIPALPISSKYNYKYPFYIAAAASVIMALLFLFQINNNSSDKMKLSELQTRYISLEKKMDSLTKRFNEKSTVNNQAATTPIDGTGSEDKVKLKISRRKMEKVELSYNNKNYSYPVISNKEKTYSYIKYISSLPMENITNDDYLTPKIPGN
jgi:hypothetical protein